MKYNELHLLNKRPRRRRGGRGISAGRGKTVGRGTKGQGARKSGRVRAGFEGGQMPLAMRLPKLRGFKSHRPKAQAIKTNQLELVKKSTIDNLALFEAGLVSSPFAPVKLIVGGELKAKKEVKVQAASAGAITILEKAGGGFTRVQRLAQPKKPSDRIE